MGKLLQFFQSVAGTGEVITIAYGGGSRPGEAREIIPLSCAVSYIEAIEPGSSVKKHYKLEKVLWARCGSDEPISNERAVAAARNHIPPLDSLSAYADYFRSKLTEAGWHIHQEAYSLGVGGYFKNGKPKKTPSVAIRFIDPSADIEFDLKTGDFVEVKRMLTGKERPWRVDSWRFREGKTFGRLTSAAEIFIEEVRASDVENSKGMYDGH